MEHQYSAVDQTFYLVELTAFVLFFFGAGYLLLGSKRKKDEPNKWYGWVFYGIAYLLILVMMLMVGYFE